jgi:hypothetical protein
MRTTPEWLLVHGPTNDTIQKGRAMRSGNFPSVAVFLLAAIIPKLSATDSGCPVTKPPSLAFVPPAPYQMNADTASFWYGAKELWTALPRNGEWRRLPPRANEGPGHSLFLWQQGYDGRKEQHPDIKVVLRRVDLNTSSVTWRYGTNAFFESTGAMSIKLEFPAEGCWEVTSFHDDHKLTFVLSIQP